MSENDQNQELAFCREVLEHLKSEIAVPVTKEELIEVLLAIASQMGSYGQTAKEYFTQNADELYKFVTSDGDADECCRAIGF
ncbi:hypothetical protein ACFWF7_01355 [Nocardia sp. NPDC060256]|uniref:hypothetical protein n=1 Tax=unclassified Nocardia TaxID=2637762 RepID=UPI00364ABBDF